MIRLRLVESVLAAAVGLGLLWGFEDAFDVEFPWYTFAAAGAFFTEFFWSSPRRDRDR